MQRTLFSFLAGILSLGIMAAPAAADHDYGARGGGGQTEIILYSGKNFRGEARVYYGDIDTLARDGFNDRARSVEIRGGAWTLCKDRAGRGRCRTIDRSISDLGRIGLDCKLTSFYQAGFAGRDRRDDVLFGGRGDGRRGNRNRGGNVYGLLRYPVTLFTSDNFRGRSVGISGPVNLRDIGFDNKADSIAISEGQWIVCKKRDLRGYCEVLSRSVYDLDDIDLDDNISSIAPYRGGQRY